MLTSKHRNQKKPKRWLVAITKIIFGHLVAQQSDCVLSAAWAMRFSQLIVILCVVLLWHKLKNSHSCVAI
jgi:hypothetical protein